MALRPLHNNVWGVTIFNVGPKMSNGLIVDSEIRKQKVLNILRIVAVGPDCKYVKAGQCVILDENSGGSVVTMIGEDNEVEHRYVLSEEACLATLDDE